jgi:ethanolamine transporter
MDLGTAGQNMDDLRLGWAHRQRAEDQARGPSGGVSLDGLVTRPTYSCRPEEVVDVNEVIVWILMFCMVLGGLDRAIGNKFGLGEKFEEGFMALGPLALAMVGVVSLAPVLAKILEPVVVPVYTALGADPSMFATTLLANDMGGYPLATEMAESTDAGLLAGLILGAMMGPTIVFTIPVALGIIEVEDRGFLAKGVLSGIITIPLGVLVGGLSPASPRRWCSRTWCRS